MVVGDLVSVVKSSFVAGHQILDGPFILNEVLSCCKDKKNQTMIFKVAFEKAHDSVRWNFLKFRGGLRVACNLSWVWFLWVGVLLKSFIFLEVCGKVNLYLSFCLFWLWNHCIFIFLRSWIKVFSRVLLLVLPCRYHIYSMKTMQFSLGNGENQNFLVLSRCSNVFLWLRVSRLIFRNVGF